jgi:hypothetical protein
MSYRSEAIKTLAAVTTTGQSGAFIADRSSTVGILYRVSAASGTSPTLDLSVEWSGDGTNFVPADGTADTFAQQTTTGGAAKSFTVKGLYYRVKWTITGTTPSFTFAVHGFTAD